jgi:hypothetical protein
MVRAHCCTGRRIKTREDWTSLKHKEADHTVKTEYLTQNLIFLYETEVSANERLTLSQTRVKPQEIERVLLDSVYVK